MHTHTLGDIPPTASKHSHLLVASIKRINYQINDLKIDFIDTQCQKRPHQAEEITRDSNTNRKKKEEHINIIKSSNSAISSGAHQG